MNLTDEMQRLSERVPIPTFLRRWPLKRTDDDFSVIMLGQCGPSQMHMEHAQNTQCYAPTKALINEFRLYPVFILRLFVLSKSVGH